MTVRHYTIPKPHLLLHWVSETAYATTVCDDPSYTSQTFSCTSSLTTESPGRPVALPRHHPLPPQVVTLFVSKIKNFGWLNLVGNVASSTSGKVFVSSRVL